MSFLGDGDAIAGAFKAAVIAVIAAPDETRLSRHRHGSSSGKAGVKVQTYNGKSRRFAVACRRIPGLLI
jgi:hypothetical protein